MSSVYQDGASRKAPNDNLGRSDPADGPLHDLPDGSPPEPLDDGPDLVPSGPATARRGRPRSESAHQAILEAARELLIEDGFVRMRLEHVAARAGVGKATIYRRWPSKEALALDLLMELASPYLGTPDLGDTRAELEAVVGNVLRAITGTDFGPVIRALLSQIAGNPALGDPFRATIVLARRHEVARVLRLGIERGDLRPDADADVATELLLGPLYFRLVFGGELTPSLVPRLVDTLLRGYGTEHVRRA